MSWQLMKVSIHFAESSAINWYYCCYCDYTVFVVLLGDSADGSMLLHDDELIKRSHSDNELLRSTKRLSVVNPATQPNSETSSLAG